MHIAQKSAKGDCVFGGIHYFVFTMTCFVLFCRCSFLWYFFCERREYFAILGSSSLQKSI